MAEVIRELGLTDAKVLVSRFEELGEEVAPLDFVCSRALGDFARLLEWAGSPQVSAKNVLLWIGGRDLQEVRAISGWQWDRPMAMPHSLQRFLLRGSKADVAKPESAPPG